MLGWLDRLAARLNKKVEPAAVAMSGAEQTPASGTAAGVAEVEKEQAEKT